jgi:hypothetical protein
MLLLDLLDLELSLPYLPDLLLVLVHHQNLEALSVSYLEVLWVLWVNYLVVLSDLLVSYPEHL